MDDFDRQQIWKKVCNGCQHYSNIGQYPFGTCALDINPSDFVTGKNNVIGKCPKRGIVENPETVVKSKEKPKSILDLF